jgi:hypothetical protein
MPFEPNSVSAIMLASAASKALLGKNIKDVTDSVAFACSLHFIIPGSITLVMNGTAAGPGTFISTPPVGMSPDLMASLMFARGASRGLVGKNTLDVYSSISTGICMGMLQLITVGIAAGVGLGSGVGVITGFNPELLKTLILSQFAARAMVGKNVADLADAISFGIVTHLSTTVSINVGIVGPIIPPPAGPIPVVGLPGVAQFS